jgi:outer membrane protein
VISHRSPLLGALAALTLSPLAAAAPRTVTLREALELTSHNSPDLRAVRAQAEQVEAKAGLVYAAVLPEVSLQGSYVYTTAEAKFDVGQMIAGILPAVGPVYGLPNPPNPAVLDQILANSPSQTIVARNSGYGTLQLTQTLFTPQLLLLPSAAHAREAAQAGTAEAREQVLLAAARVFLGTEGLAELEKAAREAEAVALRREAEAKSLLAAGMSTEIALLRAQADTAQARATLATLEGQRQSLLAILESFAGESISPSESMTHVDYRASPAEDEPWNLVPVLRAQQSGILAQEVTNGFDSLSWLPSLVAQGKLNYNTNKGFVGTNWTFDGIVAAQWTLFDRGVRSVNTRENLAKTAQMRAQLDAARARARANWFGARTQLATAEVALGQAESFAALASRGQKAAESAWKAGMGTALEVSDLDSKRFLAASAAAQARAQLEIRKVELAAAEGRLAATLGISE